MGRTTFQLPRERAAQLRRIAAERGEYVTDVIERLVREEYQRLGWTLDLPDGVHLDVRHDAEAPRVMLSVDGLDEVSLTSDEASHFAAGLIAMEEDDSKAPVLLSASQDQRATIEARRHGKGISLAINGHRKPLTVGLARDLGEGLRRSVHELLQVERLKDPRWGSYGGPYNDGRD
jgi:hypothetical protein